MSEMLEKVALAIEAARGTPRTEPSPVAWRMARAAIEAMRVPTEAMMQARFCPLDWGIGLETWRAMIDAALTDNPSASSH